MEQFLLPLFPLEIVLLPGEFAPLHIFEERYQVMIRDCLAEQARTSGKDEFGVVLSKDLEISKVGCTAKIVELKRKYPDGRMDILTEGKRRFEVLFTEEEKIYLRAGVEFFEDDPEGIPPAEGEVRRLLGLMQQALNRMRDPQQLRSPPSPPYSHLSFQVAALLPFGLEFRERLLSLRQERERVREMTREIEQMIPQLDRAIAMERKVKGNGHLRA
jgi:Lon protease-like protein